MIDISPYKFNKPNGPGKKDWVHVVRHVDSNKFIRDLFGKQRSAILTLSFIVDHVFPNARHRCLYFDASLVNNAFNYVSVFLVD